ncbi:MAG: hypothetical protein AAGG48_16045 [Planctomycetota bacterium]
MIRYLLGATIAMAIGVPCSAKDSENIDLRYRSFRNWSMHLPNEQWFAVNDGIRISHAGGDRFAVELDGNNLLVDTDGDGELDRSIKPLVDPKTNVSTTRVVLTGETDSGEPLRYAARLRKDGGGWEWAPGGAMAGVINSAAGPMPIRIIDRDGNGRFDDVGSDAMIVGTSDYATFLSKTVQIDDALYTLDFNNGGTSIRLSEFRGPTAKIDMSASFHSKAVLMSSVIVSEDRQHSFDVGAVEGPMTIPAGDYTVVSGTLGLGEHRVQITAGRMERLDLVTDSSTMFDWGGPIESEFRFARRGNQLQFSPDQIWYYGRGGEQYVGWNPIGKSPEFKILDADSGAVLDVAILPGSCCGRGFVPVVVSVPSAANIQVEMIAETFAFGKIVGKPK